MVFLSTTLNHIFFCYPWGIHFCPAARYVRSWSWSFFVRARAVIKFVLRAVSTLENITGEQRALRKYSVSSNPFSFNFIGCFY